MRKAVGGASVRGPRFQVIASPAMARVETIPAPVGGWDALTPKAAMPETNAVVLKNVFPMPGYVEIRKGHKQHASVAAVPVETILPYHGVTASADVLFAAAGSNIYDVTLATASLAASGFTSPRWQHINFSTTGGQFLWCCNGLDAPQAFDGTTWATASVSVLNVIGVAAFKERIWLVRDGEISPAYLGLDAIQGTATVFDLTGIFDEGSYLQAIGSWSMDGGAGPDDHIAFLTSQGEAAVYTGTNPASDFALVGVFKMGALIGRRSLVKIGGDLVIVSIDGVLPLSVALVTDRAAIMTKTLSRMIQPVVNASAREYSGNFGWQIISYPRGSRLILNVPIIENSQQEQYVMNTTTGAWARFTGENANCWGVFKDRLFFGGNDGAVYEADCQGYDHNQAIDIDIQGAFNYWNSRGTLKHFTMARANITTDGQVTFGLGLNVDFNMDAETSPQSFESSESDLWDVALWDTGVWPVVVNTSSDWTTVEGEGYCAGFRVAATIIADVTASQSDSLLLQINGFDLMMTDGGLMG